uniref:Cupin domain-containing protein n=1 Tax=Fundidesulfovibrio putealis TaxID=270496 RepID=A0A7C4AI37_9BACT
MDQTTAARINLGIQLRLARKSKGITLSQLSGAANCSESMLSKIETGKVNPSLDLLHRIATTLGTNISALFAFEANEEVVFKKGTRPQLDIEAFFPGDGIKLESLSPHVAGQLLQAHVHIIAPGGRTSAEGRVHEGEEVGYILQGSLELTVDGKTYHMEEGDSFYFRSDLMHRYDNISDQECRVLWVNTPPTF